MTSESRLGRGLEALLGRVPTPPDEPHSGVNPETPPVPEPFAEALGQLYQEDGLPMERPPIESVQPAESMPAVPTQSPPTAALRLDVTQIDSNPVQPRQDFDPAEMQSLAESIETHGLLQPVVVRRVEDRYQLIAGERRLRAARQAGWVDVPANIVEADDRQMAELAIVENLQRRDLNPLEKAASFQRYLERYDCTQEELAGRLKLDRSTIANLIRLLELPEPVKDAIRGGRITQGHARALLPLGDEREQIAFSERIQREALNVRQTEALVQETLDAADDGSLALVADSAAAAAGGEKPRRSRPRNEHLMALEQELRAALGMKVKITHNVRGRGKLTIHFRNHDEFERLRRQLTDPEAREIKIHAG